MIRNNITRLVLLSSLCTLIFSCNNVTNNSSAAQNEQETETTESVKKETIFNADSAYYNIEKQVSFGPRVPNSEGHKACGDWLVNQLKRYNLEVQEQAMKLRAYDGTMLDSRNIIASYKPNAQRRLLLFAHWDTRPIADNDANVSKRTEPILGADDGASGVGVLLELARILQEKPLDLGLDIIFFDAEDYGSMGNDESWCLGSQYWALNPHKPDYKAEAGILLDMVGSKDATFYWEYFSKRYAPGILNAFWDKAGSLGYGKFFVKADGGATTDDHLPVIRDRNIPCIDIINYSPQNEHGFGNYWHTHNDNMSIIDKETLQAVGHTLVEFVYSF